MNSTSGKFKVRSADVVASVRHGRSHAPTRGFNTLAVVFLVSIVFSLAGTLAIKLVPELAGVFGSVYQILVKAPTWTYMTLLPILVLTMYAPFVPYRFLLFFFFWGSAVGTCAELAGTITGYPFGDYSYTAWLGPKIGGHVPWFIPASWFAMSLVSYDLANRIASGRWLRIGLAAAFMTLWDVALDPAMSTAFPFWVYPSGGIFFGMPLSNWLGWLLVSFIIAAGYEAVSGGLPATSSRAKQFYAVNCLFPIGISLLFGLYWAALAGLVGLSIPMIAVRRS